MLLGREGVYHSVATLFQTTQQARQGHHGPIVNVMQKQNALSLLHHPSFYSVNHIRRGNFFPITRAKIGAPNREGACLQIGLHYHRFPKTRKSEKRSNPCYPTEHCPNGTDPHLNL